RYFHLPHGTWLILTVLVIVKQDYHSTRQRALERMGGSLIGGAVAILLVALIHNLIVLDILLVVLCILAYSHLPYNYGLFVVYLTPFVVLLINMT
ncbi:FUSC family protein, partial [Acinetobacter baumannii]